MNEATVDWYALRCLRTDLQANRGHPKEQAILISLRLAQFLAPLPFLGFFANITHRFITEIVYGIELRPGTRIGPGLTLFHGYATVVNQGTVLGSGVKLHQCVTIGARRTAGRNPVIGDFVEIGAGAMILGDVAVGSGARIGAGAIVLDDVPSGAVVVGPKARIITP